MLSIMIFAGNRYYWRVCYSKPWRVTRALDSQHPSTLYLVHCFWAFFRGAGASVRTAGSKRLTHSNSRCLNILNLELRYCLEAYRQPCFIATRCATCQVNSAPAGDEPVSFLSSFSNWNRLNRSANSI